MSEVLLHILELLVALNSVFRGVVFSGAAQVDDPEVLQQFVQMGTDGLVDRGGALAAAHDHDHRLAGGFRRSRSCIFLCGRGCCGCVKAAQSKTLLTVTGEEFCPDRCSGQDSLVLWKICHSLGEVAAYLCSCAETQLVGEPGGHIRLMDHTGNLQTGGCAYNGHAHKAALGEDDIRPIALEKPSGFGISLEDTEGIREIFEVEIAAQLSGGHADIGNAAVAHKFLFDSVFRADISDFISRIAERGQECDIGRYMSGCSAARENDLFLSLICHGGLFSCQTDSDCAMACLSAFAS